MARLLSCPHCRAEFAFDQWARSASCPACGRRLSFLELGRVEREVPAEAATVAPECVPATVASAPVAPPVTSAASATAVAAPVLAAPASATSVASLTGSGATWSTPVERSAAGEHRYTVGGKPLRWTAGWTVVAVIWAIAAVGMVAVRVSMGPVTVMTPAETAAIDAVRAVKQPTGATTETVLRYAATHDLTLEGHVATIPPGGTQMWYAFERPWEHRIYVSTTLPGTSMMGSGAVLSWTVSGNTVTPTAATRTALSKAAQTMAHPPSSSSVPAVPGIIPSIPPDLQ